MGFWTDAYTFYSVWKVMPSKQGRSQTFSFGGATGGASFATRGDVNGLCRTFRKRPEKFWGGHWGCQAKLWGGSGPPGTPLAPPLPPNILPSTTRSGVMLYTSRANSTLINTLKPWCGHIPSAICST